MIGTLVLGATLAAAGLNRPLPAPRVDEQIESSAAVGASVRWAPFAGALKLAQRGAGGDWDRQVTRSERTGERTPFLLRFDPATRSLAWSVAGGTPVVSPLADAGMFERTAEGTAEGANLLRLEVANFDRSASVRLERLVLSVGGRSAPQLDLGRGAMSRDLVTLWEPELAHGFVLSGELVAKGVAEHAARAYVDFGLGSGRRVELQIDGPGTVRSTPQGLAQIPNSKSAVGYFDRRELIELEAIELEAGGARFSAWQGDGLEERSPRLALPPGAGALYLTARFEAPPTRATPATELGAARAGEAGRGFSGTTYIFTNNTQITIPLGAPGTTLGEGSPYPSTLVVSGPVAGEILDVNVYLFNMNHTAPQDLDILLVAPFGANVMLTSDACSGIDLVNVDWLFDDEAPVSLSATNGPGCTAESVKPTNFDSPDSFDAPAPAGSYGGALIEFDFENANGTWSLYVMDDASGDVGEIDGWRIDIATSDYEMRVPATGTTGIADPYPSEQTVVELPYFFGTILDLDVQLRDLSHTFTDDLDVLLVGPSGDKVMLMSDACGSDDTDHFDWTFDDAAPSAIADESPCLPGPVRPADYLPGDDLPGPALPGPYGVSLSVFNGKSPFGLWKLFVNDDVTNDSGFFLTPWQLDFTLTGIFKDNFEINGACNWSSTVPPPSCE